jgi:hypothetical protein
MNAASRHSTTTMGSRCAGCHADVPVTVLNTVLPEVAVAVYEPEKEAKIEAKVWIYSDSDRLDLYRAPDAANPTWTFVATLSPSKSGEDTLSATYTIPQGGTLQAIRAVLRYGGSAAPCVPGSYSDHDDLIFATVP